jgi:hypothetical protein
VKVKFRTFVEADLLTIRQRMPFSHSENSAGIVAYDPETHETLAVLVAQEWTYTCCYVHQVILKTFVIRHGWFEEVAKWLFTQANRLKLFALVPSDNTMATKLNTKLGFKELIRLEQAYDHDTDFILMELKREECPYWIQPEMAEVANG